MPSLPEADISVPVVHQGDLLGAISIRMPRGEPLRPAGEQLVADVASQAGLVLSNAGLIEDLQASRQRLVAAQDEARRRLERNIHDGAQQDLVALAIKCRLAGITVDDDPAQTKQILGELQADAAGALANLRDLARGIYPPLLADLGLVAALNAQTGKSAVPVTVEADGIGRFPQDTEAAVYFCCLEALQNIAKYAQASTAASPFRPAAERCASPCPTTEPATTPATPRWVLACGTWPTGSQRSAAGLRSGPPPARAPPSPGTCPSPSPAAVINARQSPMAPDATKTVGKGGLRRQNPQPPHAPTERRRRRRSAENQCQIPAGQHGAGTGAMLCRASGEALHPGAILRSVGMTGTDGTPMTLVAGLQNDLICKATAASTEQPLAYRSAARSA